MTNEPLMDVNNRCFAKIKEQRRRSDGL